MIGYIPYLYTGYNGSFIPIKSFDQNYNLVITPDNCWYSVHNVDRINLNKYTCVIVNFYTGSKL